VISEFNRRAHGSPDVLPDRNFVVRRVRLQFFSAVLTCMYACYTSERRSHRATNATPGRSLDLYSCQFISNIFLIIIIRQHIG